MHANVKMAGAMGTAAKTMSNINKQISPQDLARTMQDFTKESTKMDMSEELSGFSFCLLSSIKF